MRHWQGWIPAILLVAPATASAQPAPTAAQLAPSQACALVTPEHASASAGTPNINHDGSQLGSTPLPDISAGFQGIPRSAQPPLTATQRRVLECTYRFNEANADMPYTLFVPSSYDRSKPTPLVVDLHGLNITPLQQILFDGTTDLAERFGFIVVAPMGFSVSAGWRSRPGTPVESAQVKPGSDVRYTPGELSELDAMSVVAMMRKHYNVDADRIYLMGHSLGGSGTLLPGREVQRHLGCDCPTRRRWRHSGSSHGGAVPRHSDPAHARREGFDRQRERSRRSASRLQAAGAQFIYLEFPGKDHEFWIRRGAENMEKVFLFFATVSKRTTKGYITETCWRPKARAERERPQTVPPKPGDEQRSTYTAPCRARRSSP